MYQIYQYGSVSHVCVNISFVLYSSQSINGVYHIKIRIISHRICLSIVSLLYKKIQEVIQLYSISISYRYSYTVIQLYSYTAIISYYYLHVIQLYCYTV